MFTKRSRSGVTYASQSYRFDQLVKRLATARIREEAARLRADALEREVYAAKPDGMIVDDVTSRIWQAIERELGS